MMLPGMTGFELLRSLRISSQVPVLMLTARGEDIDRIVGLEMGADDYLPKPFNPRELIARIKAVLRRNTLATKNPEDILRIGNISIDNKHREVHVGNEIVNLRTQEFELLRVLAEDKGRVYSREQLLKLAWGYSFAGQTRTVDVHVAHLRHKLMGSTAHIETITGYGYKITE